MECETAREAISAVLDGEEPGGGPGDVDQHLAECAACREWRDAAHRVTRQARLGIAQPPRRTREVAAAVLASVRAPRRVGLSLLARLGLAAVAAAQLGLTLPYLFSGADHRAPEHIAHEMGSFGVALAAGFLVAAWRPERASGMRTLVGAVAALLVVTAVVDVAGGRTGLADETPHLLAVTGWLMIRYLAAVTPPAAGGMRLRQGTGWRSRLPGPSRAGGRFPAAADGRGRGGN
jgi:predicted anti-sigma-YlaC factor YlaD